MVVKMKYTDGGEQDATVDMSLYKPLLEKEIK